MERELLHELPELVGGDGVVLAYSLCPYLLACHEGDLLIDGQGVFRRRVGRAFGCLFLPWGFLFRSRRSGDGTVFTVGLLGLMSRFLPFGSGHAVG